MYTEKECLEALKSAKEEMGASPSIREYRELDISPSISTILRKFGSWNEAKNKAGIEAYGQKDEVEEKPAEVVIPEGAEWEELTAYQRYYYKNRQSEKKRSKERKEELKRWFKNMKENLECEACGESHPACLDFHHEGGKRSWRCTVSKRKKGLEGKDQERNWQMQGPMR